MIISVGTVSSISFSLVGPLACATQTPQSVAATKASTLHAATLWTDFLEIMESEHRSTMVNDDNGHKSGQYHHYIRPQPTTHHHHHHHHHDTTPHGTTRHDTARRRKLTQRHTKNEANEANEATEANEANEATKRRRSERSERSGDEANEANEATTKERRTSAKTQNQSTVRGQRTENEQTNEQTTAPTFHSMSIFYFSFSFCILLFVVLRLNNCTLLIFYFTSNYLIIYCQIPLN